MWVNTYNASTPLAKRFITWLRKCILMSARIQLGIKTYSKTLIKSIKKDQVKFNVWACANAKPSICFPNDCCELLCSIVFNSNRNRRRQAYTVLKCRKNDANFLGSTATQVCCSQLQPLKLLGVSLLPVSLIEPSLVAPSLNPPCGQPSQPHGPSPLSTLPPRP